MIGDGEVEPFREKNDFRRAETVDVDRRKSFPNRADGSFVPGERQFRVQATLEQYLVPAQSNRFGDFFKKRFLRKNVGVTRFVGAAKRAKSAA